LPLHADQYRFAIRKSLNRKSSFILARWIACRTKAQAMQDR
jgi:hypothetical protein